MQILAVTLKNFKAHADEHFTFQPGTNAICGENGAGKTSILEAIAWVLFDYNSTYQKQEFIRSGCNTSLVTVQFLSAQDGRCYDVRRCSTKGYDIYDPQLNVGLGIKKLDDVTIWLRQHLGVPPHTELSKLFADTIGIPQGTLTTDFLKTPEVRKRTFDPILKVEEYKQAYLKSVGLETFADAQVQHIEQATSQIDSQLSDWPDLKTQYQACQTELTQNQAELAQLKQKLEHLTRHRQTFQDLETQLQTIKTEGEQVRGQIDGQQMTVNVLTTNLEKSQAAATLCQQHRASYQAYETATADLETYEQQWQALQTLQEKHQQLQIQLQTLEAQIVQQQTQLTAIQQAEATIQRLQPLSQDQIQLEAALAEQQQQWQQVQIAQQQLKTLQPQIQQKLQQQAKLAAELAQKAELTQTVATIPELEHQRDRYQHQLSHLEAARQFEAELQRLRQTATTQQQQSTDQTTQAQALLTSLLSKHPKLNLVLTALETSQTLSQELLAGLGMILHDLSDQVAPAQIQRHLTQIHAQLQTAQQARNRLAALDSKQEQADTLASELSELQAQQVEVTALVTQAEALSQQQQQIQQQLTDLNDPKGQIRFHQDQLQHQPQVQQALQTLNQQKQQLTKTLTELVTQLQPLPTLNQQIQQQKQALNQHRSSYQTYLQHQQEANRLPELTQQLEEVTAAIAELRQKREVLLADWKTLNSQYDRAQAEAINHDYELTRSACDQLQGSLPLKQQQLDDLNQQLQRRQDLAQERQQLQADLALKQQVRQFVINARSILNQSGPRITRFYLNRISAEADRLFRELLDRPDIALEWTEDYEIRVQERGHWRTFKSLSGGEQMCAALAVRLSLLRILAEIDVAFFDEPTTNMDQTRRRQLAEALGNLKSFRQLFVISHDDTFENMTENIIRVERKVGS
jgi:DNA repair protein SbcC/Rad50